MNLYAKASKSLHRTFCATMLAMMVAGCAQPAHLPPIADPVAQAQQRIVRSQFRDRLLIEQLKARNAVAALQEILRTREELFVRIKRIDDAMPVRARQVVIANQLDAGLIESQIEMIAAQAELQLALTSYCERYGRRLQDAASPVAPPEIPASVDASLAAAAAHQADPVAVRAAWRRTQGSAARQRTHGQRLASVERVATVYRRQFNASSVRMARDLLLIERSAMDAKSTLAESARVAIDDTLDLMSLLDGPEPGWLQIDSADGVPDQTCRFEGIGTPMARLLERAKMGAFDEPGPEPVSVESDDEPAAGGGGAPVASVPLAPAAADSGQACGTAYTHGLPNFDWPPGPPTTETRISSRLLRAEEGATTLGTVADRLVKALDREEYIYSFSYVPNGFALVTQIEQILDDGSFGPQRWSRDLPRARDLKFISFVQALFRAPVGRYRVIAIVVTDAPRDRASPTITAGRMDSMLRCGKNQLPAAIRKLPFTEMVRADALVYEFTKAERDPAKWVESGPPDALTHLEKAGIMRALAK